MVQCWNWPGREQSLLAFRMDEKRTSIQDFDTVTLKGFCEKDGVRIGFGMVETKLLPPLKDNL